MRTAAEIAALIRERNGRLDPDGVYMVRGELLEELVQALEGRRQASLPLKEKLHIVGARPASPAAIEAGNAGVAPTEAAS